MQQYLVLPFWFPGQSYGPSLNVFAYLADTIILCWTRKRFHFLGHIAKVQDNGFFVTVLAKSDNCTRLPNGQYSSGPHFIVSLKLGPDGPDLLIRVVAHDELPLEVLPDLA